MKTHRKGFTLIELILVIAILAILAMVAVPAYTNLREDGRRQVCQTNREILERCYKTRRASAPNESKETSLQQVLADNPTAVCPSGNVFETSFSKDKLVITCPEHGAESSDYRSLHGTDVSQTLKKAVDQLIREGAITSTSTIDSAAIQDENSRSSKIEAALKEAGFSSEGTTWNISGTDSGQVGICWSEAPLPENAKAGDQVLVIRYNSVRKTYTVGYVKLVTRQEGYLALDGNLNGSFTEYKGETTQTEDMKKDFDQIYQVYQEALAAQKAS